MPSSINNNLMAANAACNLNSHYGRLAISVWRLSSGLRVNSAADDAAGLAIRELMRTDVAAINQGVRNANDAISMLQVADGALAIIDEKLIRMKELAEQAATGTYNSTQRLMIHSEFVAMASEIDRIARATDFNGIKLLDGSLSGAHDGSGLNSTGKMKIHFGAGNDSAEDYYYVEIGDCTLAGLGLRDPDSQTTAITRQAAAAPLALPKPGPTQTLPVTEHGPPKVALNDLNENTAGEVNMPAAGLKTMQDTLTQGQWVIGNSCRPDDLAEYNFMFIIPKGTKNIVINVNGAETQPQPGISAPQGHNDIQLFTFSGVHLAGTSREGPILDYSWSISKLNNSTRPNNWDRLPFSMDQQYDGSVLNDGPARYDSKTLAYSVYNGMAIGFSGDPDRHEWGIGGFDFNDGRAQQYADYETLTIDEATEDLIFWYPGAGSGFMKAYWDLPDDVFNKPAQLPPDRAQGVNPPGPGPNPPDPGPNPPDPGPNPPGPNPPATPNAQGNIISIRTQGKAQQALVRIDDAIVTKDKARAHIGALQNRLENTVANLTIQGENLLATESRISDTDIAMEMTQFVRNQVLSQSAVAMLGQANSYPRILSSLLNG